MLFRSLESVDDWGGLSADVKYGHVDEAGHYAEEASRTLGKFKREMSDIKMITGTEIAVGTFDTFSDYFYDGLIFDWVVQSEIGKSMDAVKDTKNHIDKAMSGLYEEKVTEEFMLRQLEDQINNIIDEA